MIAGEADHRNDRQRGTPPRRIVDAHHHVWDTRLGRHPWLCENPPIRFRYGDYSAIRRPYLPADYRRDAAPLEIAASVYVETEWRDDDPAGEMDWLAGIMASEGLPSVAVAQAWLDAPDCAAVLESHAARGFVRSVRHKPRANPAPGGPAGAMGEGPGGRVSRALRRWVSASTCRRPGGTLARRGRSPTPFPRRGSSSTIPDCPPTVRARASQAGEAPWRRSPARPTSRSRSRGSDSRAGPGPRRRTARWS